MNESEAGYPAIEVELPSARENRTNSRDALKAIGTDSLVARGALPFGTILQKSMSKRFNFAALREAAREAARSAFEEIRGQHPGETFYSFSLYTNDSAQFLYAAAGTEEHLQRMVERYGQKGETELTDDDFRFAPDAEYMAYGKEHFGIVNGLLDQVTSCDGMDDDEFEVMVGKLMTAIVQGFRDLDEEGFFGTRRERDGVTLGLTGDLDLGVMLSCVEQLNPPSVSERFAKRFETKTEGAFSEIGSRCIYEMKGVALSQDGTVLVAAGDYHLFTFDVPRYEETFKQRTGNYQNAYWSICCCALSPDAEQFAIGWKSGFSEDGGIERWSLARRERLPALGLLPGGAWTLDYSPDSRLLASGGENQNLRLWSAATGELLRELEGDVEGAQCVRFSPDGKTLASVDRNPNSLRLWDVATGELIVLLEDHGAQLAFSPDGKCLAVVSGGSERTARDVRLWDVETLDLERRIRGLEYETTAVAFSEDGRLLATGSTLPGNVELWDVEKGQRILHLKPNYVWINALVFIDKQQTIAVVGHPDQNRPPVLLWDISEAIV